ncbi:hypothetical protein P691DRAFT_768345 [Macrolepiota fuliginosa MF-IS2]|uniref:Uncharacterized protein n=1 Tax=Macrolepiota fuliginosa MF-IS2 TaxID=1400762 RepID=A0A9P6BVR5_9AGAR|nr:hypothetical protein P691DRAFT_768345 [Macrolepiota fuliginosa MF-IS2]
MPRKAKNKPATNATPTYKLSTATEWFFATMNQNHHVASTFTAQELLKLGGFDWMEVRDDLIRMNFTEVDISTQDNSATIKIDNDNDALSYDKELSPAEELTNAIAAFRQWFKGNNIVDNKHPSLIDNIRCIAMMFSLIPAPHHCPTPPQCICPHQDDAPPCCHLHTDDIPPPLLCMHPHHNDKDTPMEPPTPTHAFSEAALQTPAPSHEASTPPPPPTAVATSPAAAASSAPAGPCGRPSYTGTVARNLNPAAPPFVHGPPHTPVAIPAQNPQPILSKHSKWPFFAMCGPMCRQFYIEAPTIPSDTSLPSLVNTANCTLTHARSSLKVNSAHFSPHGITCVTASVPSTSDLNIIEATLSGGLLRVHVSIPVSRSFIKIIDVPFFKAGTTTPFSNAEVDAQLQHSIIPSNFIVHWCYIWNSPKADSATIWNSPKANSATIWINLANSQ